MPRACLIEAPRSLLRSSSNAPLRIPDAAGMCPHVPPSSRLRCGVPQAHPKGCLPLGRPHAHGCHVLITPHAAGPAPWLLQAPWRCPRVATARAASWPTWSITSECPAATQPPYSRPSLSIPSPACCAALALPTPASGCAVPAPPPPPLPASLHSKPPAPPLAPCSLPLRPCTCCTAPARTSTPPS